MTLFLQQSEYIADYYGIYRDIVFHQKDNTVAITFNAYLNDELNFEYTKTYRSKEEAMLEIENYISSNKINDPKIKYSKESLLEINRSINNFLLAILDDEVHLPSQNYQFKGDMDTILILIKENKNYVH